MTITVDVSLPTPPYEQIRQQVRDAIITGMLAEGVRLPSVRQLANDLAVAPNTVVRAYRELEAESVVRSRGRRGFYVARVAASTDDVVRRLAERYVNDVRDSGAGDEVALSAVRQALMG